MAPRERWPGRHSSAGTYLSSTLRALHPHFQAPRSPLDATAAHAAQAETPQSTQTARREDKPTNQQTTDLFSASLIELTPGAAAGIAPGAAADGTAGAEAVLSLIHI